MTIISTFRGEYRWLSNFWLCPITLYDLDFPSVEHAYQAAKIADGPECRAFDTIRDARTPGEAKRLARTIPFRMRPDWNSARLEVMRSLLNQKFWWDITCYSDLGRKLIATGDAELREGNHWGDRFWGVDVATGQGENHLGRLLMELRAEIAAH